MSKYGLLQLFYYIFTCKKYSFAKLYSTKKIFINVNRAIFNTIYRLVFEIFKLEILSFVN